VRAEAPEELLGSATHATAEPGRRGARAEHDALALRRERAHERGLHRAGPQLGPEDVLDAALERAVEAALVDAVVAGEPQAEDLPPEHGHGATDERRSRHRGLDAVALAGCLGNGGPPRAPRGKAHTTAEAPTRG